MRVRVFAREGGWTGTVHLIVQSVLKDMFARVFSLPAAGVGRVGERGSRSGRGTPSHCRSAPAGVRCRVPWGPEAARGRTWTGAGGVGDPGAPMTMATRFLYAVIVAGATQTACNNDPSGGSTESSGTSSSTATDTNGTDSTGDSSTATSTGGEPTTGASTTDDSTTGEPLSRVELILAALDVAMYACPNRIWPDVEDNYRSRQVLLSSVSENRAWVWNYQAGAGEPPVVTEGPLDTLPPEWAAFFNINLLGGVLTLGISLDETQAVNEAIVMSGGVPWPDFATSLTFHEGFHFLSDQDDWSTGSGSRTVPYPEPWEPRYLREQVHRALLGQILDGSADYGAAAHWWNRLQVEHTAEMNTARSYDCTEGSAEYASLMMSALAELGCAAADADLLALAIAHLPDGQFLSQGAFDAGREFYDLGVLGGLLLRRDGAPGWEIAVEDGDPPVDQLLADVTAAPQPDDPDVQAEAQAVVAARNETVGMEIEPMLAAMADPMFTRVVTTMNWVEGSFGVGGFYYLVEEPGQPEVFLRFSATMAPPGDATIEIAQLTSLVGITTPCQLSGGSAVVLAIPTADIEVAGDVATATSPKLMFSGLGVVETTDMNGLPWLCPIAGGGAGGAPAPEPEVELHTLRAPGEPQAIVRGGARTRTRR